MSDEALHPLHDVTANVPVNLEPNWWTARHLARAVSTSSRLWFLVTDRTGVVISLNRGAAQILRVGAQVQSTFTHESASKLPGMLQSLGKISNQVNLLVGHYSEGSLFNVDYEVWGFGDTLVWLGWPQGEVLAPNSLASGNQSQSLGMEAVSRIFAPLELTPSAQSDSEGIDPLTGAWSRERLETSVSAMCAQGNQFALVVVDIDNLDSHNKTLGSDVGDSILKHIVTTLHSGLRESDAVVRLGGDECAIICPQATQVDALRLCLRLDQLVAATPMQTEGKPAVPVSVSLGWACSPSDGDNLSSLLVAADLRLYRMKSATERRPTM